VRGPRRLPRRIDRAPGRPPRRPGRFERPSPRLDQAQPDGREGWVQFYRRPRRRQAWGPPQSPASIDAGTGRAFDPGYESAA
jgi:hypothetical protein